MTQQNQLLTENGLIARLNVSQRDVRTMVSRSQIPFVRLPNGVVRFVESDVSRWIEKLKQHNPAGN